MSKEMFTILHSERDRTSFLLCGQDVAAAAFPGNLAVYVRMNIILFTT
jgi:hypothetical protein